MKNVEIKENHTQNIVLYYLKNSKKVCVVLFAGVVLGIICVIYSQYGNVSRSIEFVKETDVLSNDGAPKWNMIFLKNLIVCFLLCAGIIVNKLLSYLIIFVNGFFWGVVVGADFYIESHFKYLSLLPHGIIEITALIVCASIGVNQIIKINNHVVWRKYLQLGILIVLALIVAALIEANISYKIATL
ncbi:stage II sporulation protein M [Lachnobacterium bovis]|uniref:Stage II sporulation protein M n=1 Tax=Lachnobacterium bovis TaxID=140626 RepID=A0A1H9TYI4_9FIRM|nr:stage II sporulation protein M [Lachnobacterium bovis]SES02071.1 Stage II sporulation protein M [Lachnobacterium bovis]